MTNYEIIKGAPILRERTRQGQWEALIKSMDIGDSVIIESRTKASSLRYALNKAGFSCATRPIENRQFQVWKVGYLKQED